MNKRLKDLLHELKHHSPFTALATFIAIIVVLFIVYILKIEISNFLFHIMHPLHIFVSSLVSAGIFYKYKKNFIQAIFVGIVSSIVIGSLSDILFPYLGASIFQLNPTFHLPIIDEPILILSVVLVGSLIGINTKSTKIPHLLHVLLSVFASLFYLLAFSAVFNWTLFLISFLIVFISVIIPCCISDIVLPFFFLGNKIRHCNCK